MFAIQITEENMPEILNSLPQIREENVMLDMYARHTRDWFIIRGFVPHIGSMTDWAILPAYILKLKYEYDPNKIKTDWDQIVRK